MATGYPVTELEATNLSDCDSENKMHAYQEPRSDLDGLESDKENSSSSQTTRPNLPTGDDAILYSKKRRGSPTLQSPSTRSKPFENKADDHESTLERIPNVPQKTQDTTRVLHSNAQWVAVNTGRRSAPNSGKDREAQDQEERSSDVTGIISNGKRLRGVGSGLRKSPPPLKRCLQRLYRVYSDNEVAAPIAGPSLDRMMPLIAAANDAYKTDCSIASLESNKASTPLPALTSESITSITNSRHDNAQVAIQPLTPEATLNGDMVAYHTPDQPNTPSLNYLHRSESGETNQVSGPQLPRTTTKESTNLISNLSNLRPESQIHTTLPAFILSNTKEFHRWATFNETTPYLLAKKVSDGIVSDLRDPATAVPEDPYNDGYRYWTLPEYQLLLTAKEKADSWENIAKLLPGRDAKECRTRWERRDTMGVPDADGRHPHWHKDEEEILRQCRSENESFEEIARNLPARSAAGCRTRWKEKFEAPRQQEAGHESAVEERPWTKKETDELIECRKKGISFTQIANMYPARSKKEYKERCKEQNIRKRGPAEGSEDLADCALKKQTTGYPPSYGQFERMDANSSPSPQNSRPSYNVHDDGDARHWAAAPARPPCKNHFTSSGYNLEAARASDVPPHRPLLPPLSTMPYEYPYSAPIYPKAWPSDTPQCIDDRGPGVPKGVPVHHGSRSAVEQGVSQPRASLHQQNLPRQSEHYPFLYRRQGDEWQETDVVDPGHQHNPRRQAPSAPTRHYAQGPGSSTRDIVEFQQGSHYQPPAHLVTQARLDHRERDGHPTNPNIAPDRAGLAYHVSDAEHRNTDHSSSQPRTTATSGYLSAGPSSPRSSGIRHAFDTAGLRPRASMQTRTPGSPSRNPHDQVHNGNKPLLGTFETGQGRDTESYSHQANDTRNPTIPNVLSDYTTNSGPLHHGGSACG